MQKPKPMLCKLILFIALIKNWVLFFCHYNAMGQNQNWTPIWDF